METGSADRRALAELLLHRELAAEREPDALRTRPEPDAPAPLSFAQHRIWLLEQLHPGNATYNELAAIRLRGQLDTELIGQCARNIVRRHEILRIRITENNGEPAQVVVPDAELVPHVESLTELPPPERETEALRRIRDRAAHPFDLACAPLFRLHLVQLDSDHHILAITLHHIVSDGWSLRILLDELMAGYAARRAGTPPELPELPIQFADYARWQHRQLAEGLLAGQLGYWRGQLADAARVLDLPTDRPHPLEPSHEGGEYQFTVPPELVSALERVGRREGATLFMVLLAAFQVLLARYSNQDDIVVGTPTANRVRTETEGLIGCFVNTLVLRASMSGEPTFRELLGQVRSTVLDAFDHQDVPFERLVEELQPRRDVSRNPLFQAMFVLHNAPFAARELPGLTASPVSGLGRTAKVDLTLVLGETPEGFGGRFEYRTDLFDPGTIERMAGHLRTLLAALADDADLRVHSVPLLTKAERDDILAGWRAPAAADAPERCLHELVEEQVTRAPEAIALVDGEQRLSYADLNRRADHLAARLRARGVRRGAMVALCLERSAALVVAVLAVLKAGAAYVPLNPADPTERLRALLEDTDAPVLLTRRHLLSQIPQRESTTILDVDEHEDVADAPAEPVQPTDLAYVLFTSGSTGGPKGVLIEHRHVVRLFTATRGWFDLTERDVWAQVHSYGFDVSVFEIFGALLHGGRLVIVSQAVIHSPEALQRLVTTERVTVLCQTPTVFAGLVEADRRRPSSTLRLVLLAGERLDFRMLAPWFERHSDDAPQVLNLLGPTETAVYATCRRIRGAETATPASYVGGPLADVRLLVVDRGLRPVPAGVPGELLIAGAGVARGYLNRPDLDAARFVDDPLEAGAGRCYRTGDLVRRTADGDLEYLGRMDNQVKVRGFRIEPGEIEAALRAHPDVSDAVVVATGDQLAAYVVSTATPPPPIRDLRTFVGARLPNYMLPSRYRYLAELPVTTSGKVDRLALPPVHHGQAESSTGYVAPSTETEKLLASAWAELLGVDRIGVEDNFFELGGHSLLAVRMHQRLNGNALRFDVIDIFQHPTVRSLAAHVTDNTEDARGLDRARTRANRRRTARTHR